jgi:co-chaperonin GroES (HSP10)
MLKIKNAYFEQEPLTRYGYYLIKPDTSFLDDSIGGFQMPETEDDHLGVGLIVSSGETFIANGNEFDHDFSVDSLVIYRIKGAMQIRVSDEEYYLVPQENVFVELQSPEEEEENE